MVLLLALVLCGADEEAGLGLKEDMLFEGEDWWSLGRKLLRLLLGEVLVVASCVAAMRT